MNRIDIRSARLKRVFMGVYDVIAVNLAYLLTLLIDKGETYTTILLQRAIPVTAVFILLFWAFRVYSSMWEYAGIKELISIAVATVFGGMISLAVDIIMSSMGLATSVLPNGCFSADFYVFGTLLALAFTAGMRLVYRIIRRLIYFSKLQISGTLNRVLIVGAGDMGMLIISELEAGNFKVGKPVIAVDDNRAKIGKRIRGVPVKGNCSQIPELARKYKINMIILCMPSVDEERQNEILRIAVETGCKLKKSPSLVEMMEGTQGSNIRDVDITDLLARPEVQLDMDVCSYIKDQCVLVTGGGGSIGSELCRQISRYNPKTIVVFDIYENNAYLLKKQLDAQYNGNPNIEIRIGSIRDKKRITEVFDEFHPDLVFHAAAHKHVPLMEDSPKEAVKNNVFGTYNLAEAAIKYNVKRFVSISTDKAVNPTNVMGATKRITEMIIQYSGRKCNNSTIFTAVRFGNVLGSNGSVIPIFKEQIKNGGPVTVTDPEITRYFMTIPEAAQLVAQAGGLATGGEIFVLDMGDPVKVIKLAENLIRLSGYEPYSEIEIVFTGLRPGEKLYEELSLEEENSERKLTANDKIFVTKPLQMDDNLFELELEQLKNVDDSNVRDTLKRIVPGYKEQKDSNLARAN